MAVSAYLEDSTPANEKRRAARRSLRLLVSGERVDGSATRVLIHNISRTGLLIESDEPLTSGEDIAVELPHGGTARAAVIWSGGRFFGCQFEKAISAATLSAVQLRSDAGTDGDREQPGRADEPERFGDRLQRLRIEQGLSQTRLAELMSVSVPAVSGWEAGRARPKAGRLEALATILGVTSAELLGYRTADNLDELVAESRERIARAAGTSPERIHIAINL